ncbi:MAG TPA: FGGY family carbohydrate kinase [Gammaproteobacteria bacterium]|nr:FGGY family carbohydrate kinase [Gammaproteobacteria bacterium]
MPRRTPLFLALDQGGHASRARVFDAGGKLVAAAEKRIATRHPAAHRVEHDPNALLASVRQACRSVARQLGPRVADIRRAGLATQRSTVVCWDRNTGHALSPVISWQDRRAARYIQTLAPHAARVHRITGLVLSAHYGASKLRWCLKKLRAVRRAWQQQRLAAGPLAGFILANLLVEKPLLADPVNASRTLLWDYRARTWSPELLALFGIGAEILPECVPNQHAFGHVLLAKRKIPLTVVTGDQPAALFAQGPPRTDSIYINLGTGAFIQRLHGSQPPRVAGLLGSVLWQDAERALYVLEGTVNGAASALAWLRRQLGISEKLMLKNMPGWLDSESGVPLFLNGISGLGSPYWQADFRSRFVGHADRGKKFLAVIESIVFLLCVNLEKMRTRQAPLRRIVVTGGLANRHEICQSLADLSGLRVIRPEEREATARGVAVLLGMRGLSETRHGVVWRPQINSPLRQRYARWQAEMRLALSR